MLDEQTGSWWQQISGKAIFGPLKGRQLESVFHDEISFATWKKEKPYGRVLMPDPTIVKANLYPPANWEQHTGNLPVRSPYYTGGPIPARKIMLGVTVNGIAKAYPLEVLTPANPINDRLNGTPIVLVMDEDGRSIRCFKSKIDGRVLEFFARSSPIQLIDSQSGSGWDFSGKAVSGKYKGLMLEKTPVLKDYWFDWQTYHPNTLVYRQ